MKLARYALRAIGLTCLGLAGYGIYDNYRRCGKLFQFSQLFDQKLHHEHFVLFFGLVGTVAVLASYV